MYTVVLMAAMTAGSATPDWHFRRGCHGCHGVSHAGCHGCVGCVGGCLGGGVPYGGSCLGTWGGYSCAGPGSTCYGCWGCVGLNHGSTVYSAPDCYGFGVGAGHGGLGISFQCHGCYGAYGGWSCYGSPTPASLGGGVYTDPNTPPVTNEPGNTGGAVPPPPAKDLPKIDLPKGEQSKARSKVIIDVPQDAKLYIDGQLMKSTAARRVFQTPDLVVGMDYFYEVKIEVTRDGKTTFQERRVIVRPGLDVTTAFAEPTRTDVLTAQAPALLVPPAKD